MEKRDTYRESVEKQAVDMLQIAIEFIDKGGIREALEIIRTVRGRLEVYIYFQEMNQLEEDTEVIPKDEPKEIKFPQSGYENWVKKRYKNK